MVPDCGIRFPCWACWREWRPKELVGNICARPDFWPPSGRFGNISWWISTTERWASGDAGLTRPSPPSPPDRCGERCPPRLPHHLRYRLPFRLPIQNRPIDYNNSRHHRRHPFRHRRPSPWSFPFSANDRLHCSGHIRRLRQVTINTTQRNERKIQQLLIVIK